ARARAKPAAIAQELEDAVGIARTGVVIDCGDRAEGAPAIAQRKRRRRPAYQDDVVAVDLTRLEDKRLHTAFVAEAETLVQPARVVVVLPHIDAHGRRGRNLGLRQRPAQQLRADPLPLELGRHVEPMDGDIAGLPCRTEMHVADGSAAQPRDEHPIASEMLAPARCRNGEVQVVRKLVRLELSAERVDIGFDGERGDLFGVCGGRLGNLHGHQSANARKALRPAYFAADPSISSMRMSWLYLAMRSERLSEPVLICPQLQATARSAMVESSVSPERCDMTVV